MKTCKVENFDEAIRNSKSMFGDFIFFLKRRTHLDEKIIKSLSVDVFRWTECGHERCRIELIIDWSSLGLSALELDYDERFVRVTRSRILVNFFKKTNENQIEDVVLRVSPFERHDNVEMKQVGITTICHDEEAVPVWCGDQWFEKASNALSATFESILPRRTFKGVDHD